MELFSQEILANIGMAAIVLAIIFAILLSLGLVFVYISFKNRGVIRFVSSKFGSVVIKVLLFLMDSLYLPSRKIISLLGGNEKMIDIVNVEMRNMLLKKRFSEVPYGNRVVIVPQCLRSLECPAKFSSIEGAQCAKCGRCKVFEVTKKAESLGYKGVYIAPGGGFVRRIIGKIKPRAAIGIGCPVEVYWGMLELSNKGIPSQGVVLLRDGCVETDVNMEELFNVMEMRQDGSKKDTGD
ncbi:MAG: DUF116 domain-containing protein [Candidatus Altiarchaeota archaeon]|nr:DUF116 domain-containing protein [Candidatus Altiarchaeota archaeon]